MMECNRLPAIPLITSDPYLSIWMPADNLTDADTVHWSGAAKPITGSLTVDGANARYLGYGTRETMKAISLEVTPTRTFSSSVFNGVKLDLCFAAPALPDDLDLLSMPVTLVTFRISSEDGKPHEVTLNFDLSDRICYDGTSYPKMFSDFYSMDGLNTAYCGQTVQKPLCHSGDRITIDWGYLYLCSDADVKPGESLSMKWSGTVDGTRELRALIAYDDIVSINYFGDLCKAWYRRGGAQITDAIRTCWTRFDEIMDRLAALDEKVLADAAKISPEYPVLVSAAWRHTFAAHKLIATPQGEMALLSKENDSNGCIGTVDVSYPSTPLFLKYCPELVNALCRPILKFASLPVWTDDFAPHDAGRYPNATGQVYAATHHVHTGETYPPFYLYPAGAKIYDMKYQMPVEESGNMLIMLYAAQVYGADRGLAAQYRGLIDQWVQYLLHYGEDPGDQLCTDDFAGHLAHNVNLSAKAIVGVACYGRLIGDPSFEQTAREMAKRLMEKIGCDGNTPLTLDGQGWSMKYNLMWDRVLDLGLMTDEFYEKETKSYLPRINAYGLPLDSRSDYTKSDWICWTAAMCDPKTRAALLAPVVRMLRETTSRVPFSDWYYTSTGRYAHFIARSVQGGVFAPLLAEKDY